MLKLKARRTTSRSNRSTARSSASYTNLAFQIQQLRSALISLLGKDAEGEYNPAFVASALRAAQEKSSHTFTNASDFVRQLKKQS